MSKLLYEFCSFFAFLFLFNYIINHLKLNTKIIMIILDNYFFWFKVPTPDLTGRKEILSLYLSRVLTKSIDVELLARGTTGFTGADLENMVNQAALKAAIDGADSVTMKYLESARDKVLMGKHFISHLSAYLQKLWA